MEDPRFSGIATDPRFRPLPSRFRKVKIDQRFKGMFTEKKFKVKCTVDERGRPVKLSSNKHLKKFYELSSSEEDGDDDEDENSSASAAEDGGVDNNRVLGDINDADKPELSEEETCPEVEKNTDKEPVIEEASKDKKRKRKKKRQEEEVVKKQSESSESEEEVEALDPKIDYARGVVLMSSSSDDDDSDSDLEVKPYDQEAHDDHYWGEQDEDAESTEEATSRLAVQSMDWDRIKAYDLFMLFNSFKPASGTVHSVKIYPSEFGKEKMKEDELKGPQELKKAELDEEGEGEGKLKHLSLKDQKKVMLENLRQYQLNRLKYYYAVIEFDSAETANHVYTQCDGEEYLASCTQLDLRFIPDGMEFCEEEVKDSANYVPDNYEPKFFINPALGQSLVHCTWDENAPDRYEFLNKKYKADDLAELDMKAYLASATDEDDNEVQDNKKNKKAKSKKRKDKAPSTEVAEKVARSVSEDVETTAIASGSDEEAGPTEIASGSDEEAGPTEIASGSDEEAGPTEKDIQKYRQLLLGGLDKKCEDSGDDNDIVDMEITWDTELKDTTEKIVKKKVKNQRRGAVEMSVFDIEREKKRERRKEKKREAAGEEPKKEKLKDKKKGDKFSKEEIAEEESVQAFSDDDVPDGFDASDLLDGEEEEGTSKKKGSKGEKRKKKKRKPEKNEDGDAAEPGEDLDLLLMNSSAGGKKHFNIKEIAEYETMTKSKRKRKLKKNQLKEIEDDFQIDVKDDRFDSLYSSHLYNIDPSSQGYRKTKAMEALIEEKQRRIANSERIITKPIKRKIVASSKQEEIIPESKQKLNIHSLVKSVKTKTQQHSKKQKKHT